MKLHRSAISYTAEWDAKERYKREVGMDFAKVFYLVVSTAAVVK